MSEFLITAERFVDKNSEILFALKISSIIDLDAKEETTAADRLEKDVQISLWKKAVKTLTRSFAGQGWSITPEARPTLDTYLTKKGTVIEIEKDLEILDELSSSVLITLEILDDNSEESFVVRRTINGLKIVDSHGPDVLDDNMLSLDEYFETLENIEDRQ
jgi:hypothetical protein